jgi:hypothetical protein
MSVSLSDYAFSANQIPQLLWEDVYESHFATLVPGTLPVSVRRFCSMTLVKLACDVSWDETATALELTDTKGSILACAMVTRLGRADTASRFAARSRDIALRLSASLEPVDYGARRRMFATLATIGPDAWPAVCRTSGVRTGKPGGRERFATAWLWTRLTGGDYRLAPGIRDQPTAVRDTYRRFVSSELDLMRDALEAYGETLITPRAP